MCWKSSCLNFVSIFQPSCKILFIYFSVWNYYRTIAPIMPRQPPGTTLLFFPVAAVPPAGQCHHKNCSGTARHALKRLTRPPNSPDPNSIGGSPVPTLQPTRLKAGCWTPQVDLPEIMSLLWGLHGSSLINRVPLIRNQIWVWGILRPGWLILGSLSHLSSSSWTVFVV